MLKHVVILSDGIRGHFHQSLGVALWLERLGGVNVDPVILVPKFSGLRRVAMMKILARKLAHNTEYCNEWLKLSGIDMPDFKPGTLFISAGSSAAPFCLALAKSTGNKSAVIMTPSVLGTKPFDFAIVPEHDAPDINSTNTITTLGAPNHIYIPELEEAAIKLFPEIDGGKVLALLIGGSDANYNLSPEWARKTLTPLLDFDGKILLTTSRRTGREADNEIEKIFAGRAEYMLLASQDPDTNPIPAMMGAASHVIVTEDSVSMVSEAVTAGFMVGLLRVPRVTGKVKDMLGFGARRFDELFARMMSNGLVQELADSPDFLKTPEQRHGKDFNEAKRAAEWILTHQ